MRNYVGWALYIEKFLVGIVKFEGNLRQMGGNFLGLVFLIGWKLIKLWNDHISPALI